MIGQTVSHYKILDKLGEGGMGVVYKAQDTKLDRFVALKFLPAHVSVNEETKVRFLQEAKAAAALNHPNICTIYGVDESDQPDKNGLAGGKMFIAMEFIEGGTLRERLPYKTVNDALNVATQIGEALQEAHSKGIVHRDIKADNIMLSSKNQAKVMDFGLAKLKGSLKLTRTSSTVGTLGYMAPEQIQGGEVDHRSDIFSFGVLLFEMLTGKLPFRGEHEAAMVYSIVNEDPDALTKHLPDASAGLMHILGRALEKDPQDRYQSIADMVSEMRREQKKSTKILTTQEYRKPEKTERSNSAGSFPSAPAGFFSKRILVGTGVVAALIVSFLIFHDAILSSFTSKNNGKTMVVIPFENLGPTDKDYFVDGMTDEVTSRLSGLTGLRVIAPSSAKQYKKTTKTFKQIGNELGVNYVLQGTVRWENLNGETHVRVNPSLIKVEDGTQAWSQSVESVLSSAFKLQSDIASKVATAMDVALAQTEKKSLETSLTQNSEAYDNYLQGQQYADRSISKNDFEIAIQLLERATRLDPAFSAAYAKLSYMHSNMYWFFYDRSEHRAEEAHITAEKAIELSPQLSEAHEAMGWYYYHARLEYQNALKEFSLALEYRPGNSHVHYGIAAILRRQGNMKGAAESYAKAIAGSPRAGDIIRNLAETLTLLRDYEGAERNFDKALALTPDVTAIYWEKLFNLILWKGDLVGARKILDEAHRLGRVHETDQLIFEMSYVLDRLEGNIPAAVIELDRSNTKELRNSQFIYAPTALLRADLEQMRGNASLAHKYNDSARVFLEQKLKSAPEDERLYSALGLAYAGLGRKEEAIRAGLRAVELLPIEKEAWRGTYRLMDLARIYALTGDQEESIDLLERLLSIPSDFSSELLKIDPTWSILRANKRFQKLIAGSL